MKKNLIELGRSMVEMLAVLFIIGIISTLGLRGYRTAILKLDAQQAWESANKFVNDMRHYAMRSAPAAEKTRCSSWYCMADHSVTDSNYCFFNAKELLPPFAEGSFDNFYVFVNTAFTAVYFRNININNLCSAILPNGQASGTSYWHDEIDGITYRCYRKNKKIQW